MRFQPGLGRSPLGWSPLGNAFPAAGVPTPRRFRVAVLAAGPGSAPPRRLAPAAAVLATRPRSGLPLAPVERY